MTIAAAPVDWTSRPVVAAWGADKLAALVDREQDRSLGMLLTVTPFEDSYVCHHGYHVRRDKDALEALVVAVVLKRLAQPDAKQLLTSGDDEQTQRIRDEAAAVRARMDLAADSYADGSIDARQLSRITAKLRPEAQRLEQLTRASSAAPDLRDRAGPDIATRWDNVPLGRQRAAIDLLLSIEVLPASTRGRNCTFDPQDIRLTWKAP